MVCLANIVGALYAGTRKYLSSRSASPAGTSGMSKTDLHQVEIVAIKIEISLFTKAAIDWTHSDSVGQRLLL